MFEDDEPKKKSGPLKDLESEDLSTISVDELAERIKVLKQEIQRTEVEITAKKASKAAADAFFKT